MTLDSHTGVTHAPRETRRRISLRVLLSLLMLALSLITVGGTGLVAYKLSHRSLTGLQGREFTINNRAAANEIARLLDDPASRIFGEYVQRAKLGLMPLDDDLLLGRELAERLRVRQALAWISYSDARTGSFTGVWRDKDGHIILNRSSPGADGGMPVEVIVELDGRLTPHPMKNPEPYDPRKTEWYAHATASDGTAWSTPYDFADGQYGITASHAWRENNSSPVAGVFTVDFLLSDLEHDINDLSKQQKDLKRNANDPANQQKNLDYICVFQPDGNLLCAPPGYLRNQFRGTLGALVKIASTGDPAAEYDHLFTIEHDGGKYLAALHYVNTPTGLQCVVASLTESSHVYAEADRTAEIIAGAGIFLLFVALAVGWGIAKRISRPLSLLSSDLQKVGNLDLSAGQLKKSILHELQILIESSERMKSGLRSFLRYVPDDLVRQLLLSGRDAALGVEPRHLTIFFSDIENFTAYSERVPASQIVLDLSAYFDILTRAVRRNSGTIDKFIGDGLLAFFNAPLDVPNHEQRACEAALEAIHELQPADGTVPDADKIPFRTRISLHAGDVLVGNVGTNERFAYTVLGDAVNACSRMEALNKIYGTTILASGEVRDKAGDNFEWRHVDRVAVDGRKGTINIHELIGVKGNAIDPGILQARDLYEQAMQRYFAKDLARACELFTQASAARPGDKAAEMMIQRCDDLIKNHPVENWDGVFVHKHK